VSVERAEHLPDASIVSPVKAIRRFTVRTVLPQALEPLGELALNLRWSWHTPTKALFEGLDERLWEAVGGDPVALLGELGPDRLSALAEDPAVVRRVGEEAADLQDYLTRDLW
jgi:starch phosphorylase